MKTKYKIIYLFFISAIAYSQSKLQINIINEQFIPKDMTYNGKVTHAVKWNDNLGEHYVITTETGTFHNETSKYEDTTDAELYAYHYIVKDKKTALVWKMYDYEKDCNYDVYAAFIKKTFQITDLNNDKLPEIWLMYKTNCASDVSPFSQKIIMYEGEKKHALRGKNKVKIAENEFTGGLYEFDKTFYKAPKVFKEFAKELWNKNIMN